jgi:hypothetical protein
VPLGLWYKQTVRHTLTIGSDHALSGLIQLGVLPDAFHTVGVHVHELRGAHAASKMTALRRRTDPAKGAFRFMFDGAIWLVPSRPSMRFCYGATSGAIWWCVLPPALECFWSLTCQALLTTLLVDEGPSSMVSTGRKWYST